MNLYKELPIASWKRIEVQCPTFSIFEVYKPAVSTSQKSNYVECFNLRQ